MHLQKLEAWFFERVESREKTREFAQHIRASAGVDAGLPFIGRLFAEISNAINTNSTYKQELRRTLQNYFTDFAEAFNHLIDAAGEAVREAGGDRRILFVVAGTDRLSGDDARAFFVSL